MAEVNLRKMTEGEFRRFWRLDERMFASENVRAGRWTQKESLAKARKAHKEILPRRMATRGHHLYSAESAEDGALVAYAWLSITGRGRAKSAFVYSLYVLPGRRGQGYGAATLAAVEARARDLGAARIELHAFAHNKRARKLYSGAGYSLLSENLAKSL